MALTKELLGLFEGQYYLSEYTKSKVPKARPPRVTMTRSRVRKAQDVPKGNVAGPLDRNYPRRRYEKYRCQECRYYHLPDVKCQRLN